MSTVNISCDLLIVGGGLVGSALACALAQAQPKMQLVVCESCESVPFFHGPQFDPRVVALSESSVELLQRLGVWTAIVNQRQCAYRDIEVWDGEGNGRIQFSSSALHREQLGFIVENSVIVRSLRARITEFSNIHWLCPAQVRDWRYSNDQDSTLTLSGGERITTPLVVAADGAHSEMRDWAQLTTRRWDYGQLAIVTTIHCQQPHGHVARQRFTNTGPLALLPLPAPTGSEPSRYCSIVWSQQTSVAQDLQQLDDESFCRAVTSASEGCLGQIEWADKRYGIPLEQLHATDYGKAGFILLGDAAHRIHPLAGQGVNLGFADVAVLSEEIARARQRGVPLHHGSIYKRYQRRRKTHNLVAMASMEAFKRLFSTQHPAAVLLRNRGMDLLDQLPSVKRQIIEAAAGKIRG